MEERWKAMPGFPGYQISTLGRGARTTPEGSRQIIKPTNLKGRLYFRMRKDGSRRIIRADRAVAKAFIGMSPKDVIFHLDGDPDNNRADNLEVRRRGAWGYRVEKISPEGRVLAVYGSAAAAGRDNYMSYQTVMQRCRGQTKDPFRDGFSFRFAEAGR